MSALTLTMWLTELGRIALGSGVLIVLAALLARQLLSAVGQRTVWRTVVVGLAILLLVEASGTSEWVAEGFLWRWHSDARQVGGRLAPRMGTLSRSESTTLPRPTSDPGVSTPEGESAAPDQAEGAVSGIWWPGVVWLAGTVILLIRGLLGRILLIVFRMRHRASGDSALLARVRAVAERLGFRRPMRVLEVPGLRGPVAFGIVRPTIAVPADFTRHFDASRQEVMLTHEAAHLAARDPAWLLLTDLVSALLWWQPLVWWGRQRLRTASESAADEASLLLADGPALLAECLIELGARLTAPGSISWLSMAGNGFRSGLGRRVERLLQLPGLNVAPFRLRSHLAMIVAVAAIWNLCAILSTAWVLDQRFEEGDEPMGNMQPSWRRSLAATFLLAVLAPANDATPADEPPAPPAAGAGGRSKESRELDKEIEHLKTQIIDLDARRTALRQIAVDDKPVKELDEQIRRLEEQKQQRLAEQQEKARNEKQIRVFRLKHVKPEEVREAVESLLGAPATRPKGGGMGMGMPGMPAMMGRMGPGAGGKMPSMPGGPAGGGAPDAPGPEGVSPDWRLTVDERTRSIIIRGSRRDLRRAAEVIALLDLPAGKAAPKSKTMQAFKLKHAEAAKIAVILDELGLDARVLALEGTNRVVVAGTEAALKEAADLIEQLDVDARAGEDDVGFDPLRPRR